jgi:hypothetical protein
MVVVDNVLIDVNMINFPYLYVIKMVNWILIDGNLLHFEGYDSVQLRLNYQNMVFVIDFMRFQLNIDAFYDFRHE